MKSRGFLQEGDGDCTTIDELIKVHEWSDSEALLGCFAYATQSGAAAFNMKLGRQLWANVQTKWLFGIDYGRSQPLAIKFISEKQNADVRIYDGEWVVESDSFIPRKDFHMKTAFFMNEATPRYGMVTGSGNFSSNGLGRSIECGATLRTQNVEEYTRTFKESYDQALAIWEDSTPIGDIIARYEAKWNEKALKQQPETPAEVPFDDVTTFWIETGYVTKNRGPESPGNQIDMPRGMHRFFGFPDVGVIPRNSTIGSIKFKTPVGGPVDRNLRLGNNDMEKITLPIPETHGYELYDGKVLLFSAVNDGFKMQALEAEDFQSAFSDRLAGVQIMGSGRRYGYIE